MSDQEWFLVVDDAECRDVVAVTRAVFDILEPVVGSARIDAYTDYPDAMPPDVRAAELWLRDRGLTSGNPDPAMGVSVNPADAVGWTIMRAYSVWSTRVALYDASDACLATIEDGGHAIAVLLTAVQAAALREQLAPDQSLMVRIEPPVAAV